MASLVLNGNTSGSVTISSPAVSGTTTLTLPATTGTFALTAAPTFTGQATIPTINLTGGQITFPATQSASADANTLDDYEEGNWTPTQGAGLTVVGTFGSVGNYVKIGKQVTVVGSVSGSTSIAATANAILCGGLPFTNSRASIGSSCNGTLSQIGAVYVDTPATNIYSSAIAATNAIYFTATYLA